MIRRLVAGWVLVCVSFIPVYASGLIDNFDNDKSLSDASGAADGGWDNVTSKYSLGIETSRTFFSDASMRVTFTFTGDAFPFFRLTNLTNSSNTKNFSGDTFFTVRVYGADTFIAKFKTAGGAESSDFIPDTPTSATSWKLVTFRYNSSNLNGIDTTNIDTILFFVKPSANITASGTFYVDNFWLGYGYPAGPDTVSTLKAAPGPKRGQVRLTWTAIGDDNGSGRAQSYLIRSNTSSITNTSFNSLTDLTGIPSPALAGALDSMIVSNLTVGQRYFFAMKVVDTAGVTHSISNVVDSTPLSSSAGILLFDDFTDGYTKPNGFGKDVGSFASGGATIFITTASASNSLGGIGGALDFTYNVGTDQCGYYSLFGDTDLSAYKGISFWVKGASGDEDLLVGLKTGLNGGETKLRVRPYLQRGRITKDWQKVVMPFVAFEKLDPSAISSSNTTNPLTKTENLSFTFNTQTTSSSGQVFIDDIMFVKTPTRIPVEDFDRTADPNAGTNAAGGNTGNLGSSGSYTNQSDGTGKLVSTAVNDGVFITLIQFGDSYAQGDKSTPFIDASHLVFYAKGNSGGETLEVNFQDLHAVEKAVSVPSVIGGPLPAVWTKIEMPLDLFTGIDFENMNALHFRLAAAGQTAFVDSIVFADSSLPTAPSGLTLNGATVTGASTLASRNVLTVTADAGTTDVSMQEVRFEFSQDAGANWVLIGVDRDVSDNSYQTIWVTRDLTGAPPLHPSAHFSSLSSPSPFSPSPAFPSSLAAVPVSLSFRAVAVDVAGNTTATTTFAASSINTSKTVVYPNPYYPLQGGTMKFTNLTSGATVNIYTLSGELVVQITDSDRDGQVEWNGSNKGSDRVASGLYIYEARLSGSVDRGKLVVIK